MGLFTLIDTHAHLDDEQLSGQLAAVLDRADAAGVRRIIAMGTTASSSEECVRLAQQHDQVWACVGIQPNYVAEAEDGDWARIVELSRQDRVVAVGETGLDWYWSHAPIELQRDYFRRHLELSQQTGLPFVVHMREPKEPVETKPGEPRTCCEDIFAMVESSANGIEGAVRAAGSLRGVMHSYTGSSEMADRFCRLGMYISFAGMVTFKKSNDLREVAVRTPSDRILIETDSPYLSPEPKRGQRPNEPGMVVHTAECLAKARGESLKDFAKLTTQNAMRLFWG